MQPAINDGDFLWVRHGIEFAGDRHLNNQISWPPLRSDAVCFGCIAFAVACLALNRWPVVASLALVGAIFLAVSPRMKGPFGFSGGGGTKIGGTFDDSPRPAMVEASWAPSEREDQGKTDRDPSSSREPAGD